MSMWDIFVAAVQRSACVLQRLGASHANLPLCCMLTIHLITVMLIMTNSGLFIHLMTTCCSVQPVDLACSSE